MCEGATIGPCHTSMIRYQAILPYRTALPYGHIVQLPYAAVPYYDGKLQCRTVIPLCCHNIILYDTSMFCKHCYYGLWSFSTSCAPDKYVVIIPEATRLRTITVSAPVPHAAEGSKQTIWMLEARSLRTVLSTVYHKRSKRPRTLARYLCGWRCYGKRSITAL